MKNKLSFCLKSVAVKIGGWDSRDVVGLQGVETNQRHITVTSAKWMQPERMMVCCQSQCVNLPQLVFSYINVRQALLICQSIGPRQGVQVPTASQ